VKLFLIILIPIALISMSSSSSYYEEEIDLTGMWIRDDGNSRLIEHVTGGIRMTTEDNTYFYKKIGLNNYQMDWTPSSYSGEYRWTMKVLDVSTFKNKYEKSSSSYSHYRTYRRILV
jgi:hypothetical protein